MKRLLVLATFILLGAVAHAAEFTDITVKDLKQAIAERKATVLDVNGTESWQQGHIPGALDFESVKAKLADVLPKDKNALVVAYCGGPKCGAYQAAASAAKKLGYKNVKHLSAGISGWKDAGEQTQKGM